MPADVGNSERSPDHRSAVAEADRAGRLPFHQPADIFPAAAHEEAVARILFLAEQRWPIGWLVGPAGCGKTTALRSIRRRLRTGGREAIQFSLCGIDSEEFWTVLARHLGSRDWETGLAARRTVRGLLAASSMIGRSVTILLDDVDRGMESLWDPIAGLARILEGIRPGHTLVLATAGTVPAGDLAGRIDLRAELAPFTIAETEAYLQARLRESGCPIDFDEEAVAEIQLSTGGVPGLVNRVADLALVTAQAGEVSTVDEDTVRSAAYQLCPVEEEPLVRFTVAPPQRRASA